MTCNYSGKWFSRPASWVWGSLFPVIPVTPCRTTSEPGSTLLARHLRSALCLLLVPARICRMSPGWAPGPRPPPPTCDFPFSHDRDRACHDPRHQPGDGHVLGHVTLELHGDHGTATPVCACACVCVRVCVRGRGLPAPTLWIQLPGSWPVPIAQITVTCGCQGFSTGWGLSVCPTSQNPISWHPWKGVLPW